MFLKALELSIITLAFLGIRTTRGAVFFQNPDDLPQDAGYDFIVAGGGTAGLVVASRLGENPNWKVLVIEAGPSNEEVFETRVPGLVGPLSLITRVNWNYTTTPQAGFNGRSVPYSRALMLGGCSSHNGMGYTRGSRDDWDRWATLTGDDALSWDQMYPHLLRLESLVPASENRTTNGHIDPAVHGYNGTLPIVADYTVLEFNEKMLQASQELSEEFPFKLDMNDGEPIGISWRQDTVDSHGERASSATAYLGITGDNVHVLLNTLVTRVLPLGNGRTHFTDIEATSNSGSKGARKQIHAKKEIIVSGGVIGSPQILMNSGIGKKDELESVGVNVLVDNPSVGKNFSDHVSVYLVFQTTMNVTDNFEINAALAEWNRSRTGPLSFPGFLNHLTWLRLSDDAYSGFPDPSGGVHSPHIEISPIQISATMPLPISVPPGLGNTIQLSAVNLHTTSRGSISLNTSDPFTQPLIDLNVFSNDVDLAILREGVRSARRLFSAPSFKDSVTPGSIFPAANATSDEDLHFILRNTGFPYLHGVGSLAMSPRNATWGVVDPDFRIKGVKGLRVVDASIIPSVPSGHLQSPVYAFAERASLLIAQSWKD